MTDAVIDNDVLIKGACYTLLPDFVTAIGSSIERCGVLGAARFICEKAITARGLHFALPVFHNLMNRALALEPTDREISAAAEIELQAQTRGLALDGGESLLFAIAEAREIPIVATGDKRAIVSMEVIVGLRLTRQWWERRVLCLEQLILRILEQRNPLEIRQKICSASQVDKAISICFSCKARNLSPSEWKSALLSYIANLKKAAPTLLF